MNSEPVDIGTPYVTREDMQDSINELYVRVDHLQRTVDKNNEKLADMERALALFVHLISDKLNIQTGENNE
jgi:prefoldin subunit 5